MFYFNGHRRVIRVFLKMIPNCEFFGTFLTPNKRMLKRIKDAVAHAG